MVRNNTNARCSVCNRVSHDEIASRTGEVFRGTFHDDGLGWVCEECFNPDVDEEDDGYVYFYEDDDE